MKYHIKSICLLVIVSAITIPSFWVYLNEATSQGATHLVKGYRRQYNVLFLCADDMTTDLEPFYDLLPKDGLRQKVHTPHFKRLAENSLLLTQAYVQYPLCTPSRTSLLSGRRPDTTGVYSLEPPFRAPGRNFTSIPQYFKQNGYHTAGVGKVFHTRFEDPDPASWTEPFTVVSKMYTRSRIRQGDYYWHAVSSTDRRSNPIEDDVVVDDAVKILRKFSKKLNDSWFLAVGFRATHRPTIFPEHFRQYYPMHEIKIPVNLFPPAMAPTDAMQDLSDWGRQTGFVADNKTNFLNITALLEIRQAYYSALTYIDDCLGRLLDELDSLGVTKNTIVSFWSDHGFAMGEQGRLGKHNLYDQELHSPMIIKVPGLTDGGVVVRQPTEFVDLFPTLVEVAGLPPVPPCPEDSAHVALCHEGMSMAPLISNPTGPWKKAAFSQVRNGGHSIRTQRYRYTERAHGNGQELYDHDVDPYETRNLVGVAKYTETENELRDLLRAGWREGQRVDVQ